MMFLKMLKMKSQSKIQQSNGVCHIFFKWLKCYHTKNLSGSFECRIYDNQVWFLKTKRCVFSNFYFEFLHTKTIS